MKDKFVLRPNRARRRESLGVIEGVYVRCRKLLVVLDLVISTRTLNVERCSTVTRARGSLELHAVSGAGVER